MSTTPALVLCDPQIGATDIAALTLLDRLLVALHRAGCAPITVVCPGPVPRLRRAPELGVAPRFLRHAPSTEAPTFLASASVLVEPADIRSAIASAARLATADGRPLPLGLAARFDGDAAVALTNLPALRAQGVAEAVTDAHSAQRAERRLWRSLASSTDGLVDRHVNRPLGRWLSKILIRTPVTPNQITVGSALIGLLGAWCFSWGTYAGGLVGALLFQFSALVDCVDGEVARIVFRESPIGKWLDICLDQAVHIAVFFAIGVGLWRGEGAMPALLLGASAGLGALISFAVILRGLRRCGPDRNARLGRLIDATTNRDFSVLLIGLACAGRLEWFLWLAGILVHPFWMAALWLQLPGRRPTVAGTDAA